ncbi:MAG: helix-turn-helix transcriptional regulator [Spirochaetes bacterium]|nr:helix-turn-helix transcriptional regulator [Spirochaetota bacterium]
MINDNLGELIKERRQTLGMTQEEFCERANISTAFLSSVENGKRNMSLTTFCSIVKALEMRPESFFKPVHSDDPSIAVRLPFGRSKDEMLEEIMKHLDDMPREKIAVFHHLIRTLK